MSKSATEFLRSLSGKPFVVQFVLSLQVGGTDESVTQIRAFLIPSTSETELRDAAQEMMESLSERYRNRNGEIVTVRCEGIHSINELDLADSDGSLELGNFQFSKSTRPSHLIHDGDRQDLPLLE